MCGWCMSSKITVKKELVDKWYNSSDPRAIRVRKDIIKGVFWCRNYGFNTDMDYLESDAVLLDSIKRCGYKFDFAGDFT